MTLARRARLRQRTPIRRKAWLRSSPTRIPSRRATERRRPPEYDDPAFIAWLETQPCRVTGKVGRNVAHHLRHTATGAPMGARLKDDRRAITLVPSVHVQQLHGLTGCFKGWTKKKLRAWENEQLAVQRAQYNLARAKTEPDDQ